jgi:hypothetical protein
MKPATRRLLEAIERGAPSGEVGALAAAVRAAHVPPGPSKGRATAIDTFRDLSGTLEKSGLISTGWSAKGFTVTRIRATPAGDPRGFVMSDSIAVEHVCTTSNKAVRGALAAALAEVLNAAGI